MSTKMRDREIRAALRSQIESVYRNDATTIVIDELGLCEGEARVDIAVVNGSLTGFEIKSEADTLQRLPRQVDVYSRLLDEVTVVSSPGHLEKVKRIVPDWWGLLEVYEQDGDIAFRVIQQPQKNPSVDPFSVAQLLWRSEALNILNRLGRTKGLAGKPRSALWKRVAESQDLEDLKSSVRQALKFRADWRSDRQQKSNDDSCRFDARPWHCQEQNPEHSMRRLLRHPR